MLTDEQLHELMRSDRKPGWEDIREMVKEIWALRKSVEGMTNRAREFERIATGTLGPFYRTMRVRDIEKTLRETAGYIRTGVYRREP